MSSASSAVAAWVVFVIGVVVAFAVSCSSPSGESLAPPDVVLTLEEQPPDWFDGSSFLRIEQPASHQVLGTADWDGGERVVVRYTTAADSACYAVVTSSGFQATCDDGSSGRSVVALFDLGLNDSGSAGYQRMLVRTDDRVTEVRVTTADGRIWSSAPLGEVGLIEWRNVADRWVLELYDGDTLVHRES